MDLDQSPKLIAVATQLELPLRRCYELVYGIQCYSARQELDWTFEVAPYPELRVGHTSFDGIIGRMTTECVAAWDGVPMVNTWQNSPHADALPSVFSSSYIAAEWAVEHLVKRGHKQFAQIGIQGCRSSDRYRDGAIHALRQHGMECATLDVDLCFDHGLQHVTDFHDLVREFIAGWSTPMAVLASTDAIARALVSMITDRNWKIPTDIAIVGMNNESTICSLIAPTLTSVDLGYQRVGFQAARMLHDLINGNSVADECVYIPPKGLVVRQSTDCYAVRDSSIRDILRFMASNLDKALTPEFLAARSGVSRRKLERRFRKEVGHGIARELTRMRLERVKQLLVETDLKIKEVWPVAGFGSHVAMNIAFKSDTGMSPSKYRSTHSDIPRL